MRENTPAEINVEHYDEYVEHYTKIWNDHLIDRIIFEINERKITSGLILDIGTGTAQTLVSMARNKFFLDFSLEGVDYFNDMVGKANENILKNNLLGKVKVIKGDVHALPYSDNYANVILGRSVIHHWANPTKAFIEIFRVLKKNGFAIIHEPSRDPDQEGLELFNSERRKCGVHDVNLEEKYTINDVVNQIKIAGLQNNCSFYKGQGVTSIGFEVLIFK